MNIIYKNGNTNDMQGIKDLAIKAWTPFQKELTPENWEKLKANLYNDHTYKDLLNSTSFLCTTDDHKIIGMAFLVSSGNPTELFDKDWSYIRYVSVDPDYGGKGIGKQLTENCIEYAKRTGEKVIALHTSEMMNAARHIYESLGFIILKEIEQRLGKRYWIYSFDIK